MHIRGIKRALQYILLWVQIIILLIQHAVNANAILYQLFSHQDYHITHAKNVELKAKKKEQKINVIMIKENQTVKNVMVLLFVNMIKINQDA